MDASVIVMIVTLMLPDGQHSVSVKQMLSAAHCQAAAKIEASDPFVASVACSALEDGTLEIKFPKTVKRKIPQAVVERSTG